MPRHDEEETEEITVSAPPILRPYYGAANWTFNVTAGQDLTTPTFFFGGGSSFTQSLRQQELAQIPYTIASINALIRNATFDDDETALFQYISDNAYKSSKLQMVLQAIKDTGWDLTFQKSDQYIGTGGVIKDFDNNTYGAYTQNSREGWIVITFNENIFRDNLYDDIAGLETAKRTTVFQFLFTAFHEISHIFRQMPGEKDGPYEARISRLASDIF